MLSCGGKILGLWIITMDFTPVWGCCLKQNKVTKAVVHEIVGPGLRSVTRQRDVASCEFLLKCVYVVSRGPPGNLGGPCLRFCSHFHAIS